MQTQTCSTIAPLLSRRSFLQHTSLGFGWLALGGLYGRIFAAGPEKLPSPLLPKKTHFAPRAKRVIFLCMRGGPSHVDTFDYKPKLQADAGKQGRRPGTTLLPSKWEFKQHGQSGLWLSSLFPNVASHADKLCLVRSMQTNLPAHPQAFLNLHTGSSQFIRPSLGSWSLYGLGTENENLPGFLTITPSNAFGGAQNYGSAFLPAIYQGTRIGSDNRPLATAAVRNLKPLVNPEVQKAELGLIQKLNRLKLARDEANPEMEGMIESYELAFRMQNQMPKVMDLTQESTATQQLYGIGERPTEEFGKKCLLARRAIEAGVRFVEINHGNWDHHFNLSTTLANSCAEIDKPISGLLTDLEKRGLLKDTLVIWSGEFGRTPHAQTTDGRDHNNKGFTLWMAGGGVKAGFSYGETDEYGYDAVVNPVPVVDWHATVLALLGLEHEKLTFRHAGRDFRLTDTKGRVVQELLA